MDRCGGSRKFSKLDIEYDSEMDQEYRVLALESVDGEKPKLRQGSPKSGKRIIDSLTCSQSRRQVDSNDSHESTTRVPVVSPSAPINLVSPRQRSKMDAAIDRVATSRESTPRHAGEDASPSWKFEPMYNKAEDEVRLPRKNQPVIPERIPREEQSVDVEEFQTVPQKDSSRAALCVPLKVEKETQGEGLRPPLLSDKYNDIQNLIARVERLDALSKSGEETAVASVDGEAEPPDSNTTKDVDTPSNFVTVDRPERESSDENARSQEKIIAAPTVKDLVDGSHDFQVIYRRRPRSPGSTFEITSASSVTSMSLFGIPTVNSIRKLPPISSSLHQESLSADKQPTAHPFLWRTHPMGTFTSYGPNVPKARISPLRDGPSVNQDVKVTLREATISDYLIAPSPRMTTVEKEEGNGKGSEAQVSEPSSTFWSKDTDPNALRPNDYEGLVKLTPPPEQPRSPARREFKTQKREKIAEIQTQGTKNASTIHFPEFEFSTSWTGT